ncbi:MAG: primosomal protein N' [Lachnospiraceae bacterium]|nr:primosomal protein N' [Lachnospiraceae bacterium]
MKELYANIIVDISHEKLDKIFQYAIPEHLQEELQVGMVAEFPFGMGNRLTKGYVVGITDQCEFDKSKIKSLIRIVEKDMGVESEFILLAEFISRNYGSTMLQALKTVVPIKQKVQAVEESVLTLAIDELKAKELLATYQQKDYKAKVRLLIALLENKEHALLKSKILKEKKGTPAVIKSFQEAGIIQVITERNYRNPNSNMEVAKIADQKEIVLSHEQAKCVEEIWQESHAFYPPKAHLIHGVTGSGKTVIYMELIRRVIKEGRQAIVLIPEIALTFQTVERFKEMFGERVSFMHSRLSKGERFDQFERAMKGEIDIMVGPRSALFTPFKKLGIIVIDEEHENTYKSETTPKYHAREVAIERAGRNHGFVVLGSATPSVESYYKAQTEEYKLYTLKERYAERSMAEVEIVDLREELRCGNRSILSRKLRELITERLQKKEQIMLFINRRGFAGFVSCRACGRAIKCPHCDVSLSLHNNGKMVCHYCGYEMMSVKNCPTCGSKYIGAFKAGTQQIEEIVKKEFPMAKVLRMDMDTTRNKEGHARILNAFSREEADILIGTQMIVKGHDFPKVTLVGALAADMSLYANDYHAAERTFELLTQAAGRAGRGERKGQVIIQTYSPDNYSIQCAAKQDYPLFFQQEMAYRKLMNYPPAMNLLAILMTSLQEEMLEKFAEEIKKQIEGKHKEEAAVIGPAQATVSKIQDYYRKVIYIKHENYDILTKVKDTVEFYVKQENQYPDCFIQFDFNPVFTY